MKLLQLLSRISIFGIFILTVQILFFKKYFPQNINNILLYFLIVLLVTFPIVEILKKKAKHENKQH
jgi:hypothetical protein